MIRRKLLIAAGCLLFFSAHAEAAALIDETVANTAPVFEPDWELLLRKRVEEASRLGLMREAQTKTQLTLMRHARRPVQLELPRAQASRTRRLVVMPARDMARLTEPVQEVLAGFERRYVFIDADDRLHLAFARSLAKKDAALRIVAVAGDIQNAARKTSLRIYADQGARLTRRFAIEAVPSVLTLKEDEGGIAAVIEEIALTREDEAQKPAREPLGKDVPPTDPKENTGLEQRGR